MPTFFAFSDESGKYKSERSDRFLQRNPFYVRSTVLINSNDWKRIREEFCALKTQQLGISINDEVKWCHLWLIKRHEENGTPIPADKDYYFLRNHNYAELLNFVDCSLELLQGCNRCYMYFTVTFNKNTQDIAVDNMFRMHIQNIMQRIEYELQGDDENLCIIVLDSVDDTETDKHLRSSYQQVFYEDRFVEKYKTIVDSSLIDFSHHNTGLQLADFCAGIFNGFLRGFSDSTNLLKKRIFQYIRDKEEKVIGYGISNIPSKITENRKFLERKIKEVRNLKK